MTWVAVVLAGLNVAQICLLAWISAWQARAAALVRAVNGQASETLELVRDVHARTSPDD